MIRALFQSKPASETLEDTEFGSIVVRRNAKARYVRLRMSEDGKLSVTLPRLASLKNAFDLIETSRPQIRKWQARYVQKLTVLNDGDTIGRSHMIRFTPTSQPTTTVKLEGLVLHVRHPQNLFHTDSKVQKVVKPYLDKALQKEARAYLPRRLRYLADTYGFSFERIRYGTQKGRWGSCSSRGTISLNVGLMLLEPEIIDYVLIHELCHTKQMNHSTIFWKLVESCMPDYKARRKVLKSKHPTL